jgi:hypothetical protein
MGMYDKALEVLAVATEKHPENFGLRLHRMVLMCLAHRQDGEYFNQSLRLIQTTPVFFNSQIFDVLDQLISLSGESQCRGLSLDQLDQMTESLIVNPNVKGVIGNQYSLAHLKGAIALGKHDGEAALVHFSNALKLSNDPETGMVEVALLANKGFFKQALEHLQTIEQMLATTPVKITGPMANHDFPAEIARLRKTIQEDLAHQSAPASVPKTAH